MKTSITRTFSHGLLVDEINLNALVDFVSPKYQSFQIVAICSDGSRLESNNIADIIAFENPNYRAIISLTLEARTSVAERFSLRITSEVFYRVAEMNVESESDERALYVSSEVIRRLNEMKPWYAFLVRYLWSMIFGLLSFGYGTWQAIQDTLLNGKLFNLTPSSISQISILSVVYLLTILCLVIYVLLLLIDRLQNILFPKVFFLLGKQKQTMASIEWWRQLVFGGIVLAIVTGVLGNFIYSMIAK